jgi:hypothetical protein
MNLPEPDGVILSSTREDSVVRTVEDKPYRTTIPLLGVQAMTCVDIPEADGLIFAI